MTPHQTIGLACRFYAVWLMIGFVKAMFNAQAWEESAPAAGPLVPYVVCALYFVAAVGLWMFPMTVAGALLPRTRFDDKLVVPADRAVAVACVILGLAVLVFDAVPLLSRHVSTAALAIATGQPLGRLPLELHVDALQGGLLLAAGLVLVLQAPAIARRLSPTPAAGTAA